MTRPILLVVCSDVHGGSTLAACPPEGVTLDDGGTYMPSKLQLWIWERWCQFWDLVAVRRLEYDAEVWAVLNGDLTEGDHHGTSQIISKNAESQKYVCKRIFSVLSAANPDRVFIVRGTEAHVGPSGMTEEAFAESIKAEKSEESGRWSWWHLRLAPHGCRVDLQHHPSTRGSLPWTRPQAAQRLAFRIWSEHALRDIPYPHYAFRSHLHVHSDSGKAYPTRAIITAAWQAKTSHAHQVASDSIADMGGHLLLVRPDGTSTIEHVLYEPDLPKIWSPSDPTD